MTRRIATWNPSPALAARWAAAVGSTRRALELGTPEAIEAILTASAELTAATEAELEAELLAGRHRDLGRLGASVPAGHIAITSAAWALIASHAPARDRAIAGVLVARMDEAKDPQDLTRRRFVVAGAVLVADLVLMTATPPRWVVATAQELADLEDAAAA